MEVLEIESVVHNLVYVMLMIRNLTNLELNNKDNSVHDEDGVHSSPHTRDRKLKEDVAMKERIELALQEANLV